MINKKELAVCRRRGHGVRALGDGWAQCKWCGMWLREVRTVEEREDTPPIDEQNMMTKFEHREAERRQKRKGRPGGNPKRGAKEWRMTPVETVLEFLNRINQRDAGKLAELMTEDHVFIDSLGQTVCGREKMRAGWIAYYVFCPDYWVSHEEILSDGNRVAVFGEAGGTIAANKWRIPAAWRAMVENSRVKEWRVYADNKPVYDILAKSQAPAEPR